jgi:hypothetical protein
MTNATANVPLETFVVDFETADAPGVRKSQIVTAGSTWSRPDVTRILSLTASSFTRFMIKTRDVSGTQVRRTLFFNYELTPEQEARRSRRLSADDMEAQLPEQDQEAFVIKLMPGENSLTVYSAACPHTLNMYDANGRVVQTERVPEDGIAGGQVHPNTATIRLHVADCEIYRMSGYQTLFMIHLEEDVPMELAVNATHYILAEFETTLPRGIVRSPSNNMLNVFNINSDDGAKLKYRFKMINVNAKTTSHEDAFNHLNDWFIPRSLSRRSFIDDDAVEEEATNRASSQVIQPSCSAGLVDGRRSNAVPSGMCSASITPPKRGGGVNFDNVFNRAFGSNSSNRAVPDGPAIVPVDEDSLRLSRIHQQTVRNLSKRREEAERKLPPPAPLVYRSKVDDDAAAEEYETLSSTKDLVERTDDAEEALFDDQLDDALGEALDDAELAEAYDAQAREHDELPLGQRYPESDEEEEEDEDVDDEDDTLFPLRVPVPVVPLTDRASSAANKRQHHSTEDDDAITSTQSTFKPPFDMDNLVKYSGRKLVEFLREYNVRIRGSWLTGRANIEHLVREVVQELKNKHDAATGSGRGSKRRRRNSGNSDIEQVEREHVEHPENAVQIVKTAMSEEDAKFVQKRIDEALSKRRLGIDVSNLKKVSLAKLREYLKIHYNRIVGRTMMDRTRLEFFVLDSIKMIRFHTRRKALAELAEKKRLEQPM